MVKVEKFGLWNAGILEYWVGIGFDLWCGGKVGNTGILECWIGISVMAAGGVVRLGILEYWNTGMLGLELSMPSP